MSGDPVALNSDAIAASLGISHDRVRIVQPDRFYRGMIECRRPDGTAIQCVIRATHEETIEALREKLASPAPVRELIGGDGSDWSRPVP